MTHCCVTSVQFCDRCCALIWMCVTVCDFDCVQGQPPCLSELRLSIPSGCLTAVVGEVGAGARVVVVALCDSERDVDCAGIVCLLV